MSVAYTWVGWNRQKRIYDTVMVLGVLAFLLVFVAVGNALAPAGEGLSDVQLFIRALGTAGFVLLHIVLCIGPLARLNPRLLPILYNRRHLGVMTFLVGLAHAGLSTIWYHGFGDVSPVLSLLASNTNFRSISQFPFELLGAFSLVVLFLMAATSHDFWLHTLTPRVWKNLHMMVYLAYGALVLHVVMGVLQYETSPVLAGALMIGVVLVGTLHIAAALRERRKDRAAAENDWIDVGAVMEIPVDRARVVCLRHGGSGPTERVAVFRYDGKVSAVSTVCRHQGGPLGEGKIVDGCITCPWHGYQYLPESGQSPPPFTEKIETYQVRIEAGRVLVSSRANAPGTRVAPAVIQEPSHGER